MHLLKLKGLALTGFKILENASGYGIIFAMA